MRLRRTLIKPKPRPRYYKGHCAEDSLRPPRRASEAFAETTATGSVLRSMAIRLQADFSKQMKDRAKEGTLKVSVASRNANLSNFNVI